MLYISSRTTRLIGKCFSADEKDLVISLLNDECGNNLPFFENSIPSDLERIHFAIIKLSNGELDRLESAIELAKTDWRDLLVAVGFENDLNGHNVWADSVV